MLVKCGGSMIETIYKRRSIRKYQDKPIEEEKLNEVLRCAMYAPSAMNKQPWDFIVCTKRELLDEIQKIHPYSSMLKTAPCCIIVTGNTKTEYATGSYIQDCAAAVENLLLGAASVGLGTCWLGIYPDKKRQEAFREFLNMPQEIMPFCAIAIGYPNEEIMTPNRFDKSKIHFDKW